MKDLPHIGTIELVSLPDDQIQAVPAKIDTGADNSAIWATNVTESGNKLSFILFGKSSSFYTGKVLSTTEYKIVSVKNSFGKSELRYKVYLKIKLCGRTIRARFTLANRAGSRYPVLIGRRTLHGKFLVDVTRKSAKLKLNILMLSTKYTDVTKKFADSIQQYGKELYVTYSDYKNICFLVQDPGTQVTLLDNGQDIASFDLVHFKTTSRYMDVAAATARYLEKRNVLFIDQAIRHFPSTSKLYQYIILENSDLKVPRSVFMLPSSLAKSYGYLIERLGLPLFLKITEVIKANTTIL